MSFKEELEKYKRYAQKEILRKPYLADIWDRNTRIKIMLDGSVTFKDGFHCMTITDAFLSFKAWKGEQNV